MPGIHLEVTSDCIGCGACTEEVCFIDVIHVVKGRAVIDEECRGCGKCITACPENAIQLIIDDDDFILNAISRLKSAVDVR
jgi:ferredoxin